MTPSDYTPPNIGTGTIGIGLITGIFVLALILDICTFKKDIDRIHKDLNPEVTAKA